MFNQNRNFRSKTTAKVTVTLATGDAFDGYVFLNVGDRLIDLLNDERAFIPVRRNDGETLIVAKQQVASIIEAFNEEQAEEDLDDIAAQLEFDAVDDEPADDESTANSHDPENSETDDNASGAKSDKTDTGKQNDETGNGERAKEQPRRRRIRRFDPYETLRVARDASIAEIRAAYKTRIKAVHPDSIAALGLDDDLTKAALKSTQRVNYAYRKIMQERDVSPSGGPRREKETTDENADASATKTEPEASATENEAKPGEAA